jgi:hypothetical protein
MQFIRIILLTALGLAASLDYAVAQIIEFPISKIPATSPNGKFSIVNEDNEEEPNHVLYIKDNKLKTRNKILYYNRHVAVLWSVNSKRFFINNYKESNLSDCEIFSVISSNTLSVAHALTKEKGAILRGNDDSHLYITCLSWIGSDAVLVSARGYDGRRSGSINRELRCDLQATRMTCRTRLSER